jgi:hypothetical protein
VHKQTNHPRFASLPLKGRKVDFRDGGFWKRNLTGLCADFFGLEAFQVQFWTLVESFQSTVNFSFLS